MRNETMVCQDCNAPNPDGARFCSQCGTGLENATRPVLRNCHACGHSNVPESLYCAECGSPLSSRPTRHIRREEPRKKGKERHVRESALWKPGFVALVLVAAGILIMAGVRWTGDQQNNPPQRTPPLETRSNDAALEAKVTEIASQFICGCGTCGELPLETCTCETAVSERQLIRSSLQAGQSPSQIVAAVNSQYGWLKSSRTFRTQQKGGVAATSVVPGLEDVGVLKPMLWKTGQQIATTANRTEIFSQFKCPCGQCGIDELKDCNCSHAKGAAEIKAFVDQKISEEKYTVAQVVEEIEKRYGGRKL